jgi:hypothetical protein
LSARVFFLCFQLFSFTLLLFVPPSPRPASRPS